MSRPKAIAVVSGGLDSVTLAHLLHAQGYQLHLLSFDYGQRHRKELFFAERCAQRLEAAFSLLDLRQLGQHFKGSALTDESVAVPDGHYAAANMAITVVPNRNAIMLAIAYGIAVAEEAEVVAFAAHAGDHFIYPDCRPAFIEAFGAMERLAVEGHGHPRLHLEAPFAHLKKEQIVCLGAALGVPFVETWSCYKGGEKHCGTCGTCNERKEAFQLAGVPDPTDYLQ
ncbi:7-cyano-7-deazaguanine synthase QueC [Thermogemmatispora tikiterensis]|uniref:7-cyano-7-deazaguanine synthase n=1 Tax=Thermogemmatispora tikiterensis TaxID=1825093 RepID=A0A328VFA0_9CHLR|nr:7-cyano-7-deazaguanine synthase QueC [Thermogemmatispora tikiterensis]RAQ95579.1 7-cyano-7-deazaguanine synthase QueC [Thermogemmatispora tikiterensis]